MMDVRTITYYSLQFDADEGDSERLMKELAPLEQARIRVRPWRASPVPPGDYSVYAIKGWSNPAEGASPRMVEVLLAPASQFESLTKHFVDFDELVRRYERARST